MIVFEIPAGCTSLVTAAIKRELAFVRDHPEAHHWYLSPDEPAARLTICSGAVPVSQLLALQAKE